ncbi:conserved hypothetical protein [Solidesulfovibrio fructosivorans JJ]]|uniref:Uncharacterized protein n=1 Tax=Solidesulfovibrio fructosivorans JJ] TaxID=596151 RepID=E1K0P9_SOLFR|nr:hypothetical protein [Solidesulfovibrio fructosivorans]EFL49813.1 conserved hypothetical protein [Solidesulfovibrio fructosivorans JJ]]
MTETCQDPLRYLVECLCCRVYLDGGDNVRLAFSRRHGLKDMMTAQGIARSYAGPLRDRLHQLREAGEASAEPAAAPAEARPWAEHVATGAFCPLI